MVAACGLLCVRLGSASRFFASEILSFGPVILLLSLLFLVPGFKLSFPIIASASVAIGIAGPLIISRVAKNWLSLIPLNRALEFAALSVTLVFALTWRWLMPADGLHALNALYSSEDNSGIISNLARGLQFGFDYSTVQSLGVFSNILYASGAAVSSGLQGVSTDILLAPLTHWNVIVLFLACIPLILMLAISLFRDFLNTEQKVLLFLFTTATTALLVWPFATLGHLSVVSAIYLLIPILALLTNSTLLRADRILYLSLVASGVYLAANAWFPLVPVSIGILGIVYWVDRRTTNRHLALPIVVPVLIGLLVRGWDILSAFSPEVLLSAPGGTREANVILIVIWMCLLLGAVAAWERSTKNKTAPFPLALGLIVTVTAAYWLLGTVNGFGDPGYGATKFLLVSICFSIPSLMLALGQSARMRSAVTVFVFGIVSVFSIAVTQREIGTLLNSSIVLSSPLFGSAKIVPEVEAILLAAEQDPDRIYCASPAIEVELSTGYAGYLCSRWASSLLGSDDTSAVTWRYALIGTTPAERIQEPIDSSINEHVIFIQVGDDDEDLEPWWDPYIPSNWHRMLTP